MIITIGLIITLIGFLIIVVSMSVNDNLGEVIFIVGITLTLIGLFILIITIFMTATCRIECYAQNLNFKGQEIDCQGELVCYCKAPLLPVKPKVVIVK